MLVVCNGAAKSGSTWLYNIVMNLAEFDWPETRFISQSNTKHPTVKEVYLSDFLRESEFEQRNVISKNHYGKDFHRELLLSNPQSRVIDMSRDARDVIVSSYYDSCRRDGFQGSFEDYYWLSGRFFVDRLRRYHDVWAPPHPQIMVTSYEELKSNFDGEVRKIAAFLGVEVGQDKLSLINERTNIDSLRMSYRDDPQYNSTENPFFRKGEVGDWKNHFTAKMIKDFDQIERKGIGRLDLYNARNRIREIIHSVFGKRFS